LSDVTRRAAVRKVSSREPRASRRRAARLRDRAIERERRAPVTRGRKPRAGHAPVAVTTTTTTTTTGDDGRRR